MDGVALNLALVLLFVLFGGFFAAAEIALVSLRDSQLRQLVGRGRRGARLARLKGDSNRYLSAVQIGVTFAGFFASSYGGATIAVRLEPVLEGGGLPVEVAATVALVLVTMLVSYLSLVLGELVPKRLALQKPGGVALATAGVLDRVASVCRPVIWVLSVSTNAVVRALGIKQTGGADAVSEEELRDMVRTSGDLAVEERQLLSDAFKATDRVLSEVMVPRTEVEFLHTDATVSDAVVAIRDQPHSRYPVMRDTADDVVGFVHVRDLLTWHDPGTQSTTVGDLARPIAALPRSKPVLAALADMRRGGGHLALVVDEYGGTDGVVTLEDLVEEIVGEIWDEYDPSAQPVQARRDGVYHADGLLHLSDVEEQTGIVLPDGPYDTLAGYVVSELGHTPTVGESITAHGHRFAVHAMDRRRISQVLITRIDAPPAPADPDSH